MGEISGLLGRFEQARRSFRHLIEVAPKDGRAYFNLVDVGRIADQDRPLIARIEAMLNGGDLSENSRMRLLFALGKAYDDLDEPARAMQAFDAANAIRARLFAMDRGAYEEFASWLMRRFSVHALRSRRGSGSADERPVLILGMPRSGTTLAEQIVSSHPAVAAGDELSFWGGRGHALRGSAPGNDSPVPLAALATDYSALLSDISRTALQITDENLYNLFWIGLIHLAFPNARFIHCRRNPVATCLSIYMTYFSTKAEFSGRREDWCSIISSISG